MSKELNATDRIALQIGRLIIQVENLSDENGKLRDEREALKVAIEEKGKLKPSQSDHENN